MFKYTYLKEAKLRNRICLNANTWLIPSSLFVVIVIMTMDR
jgi:hypothetical protein